jgi:hypothetical protein
VIEQTIRKGQRVSYMDMSNPRRFGTVTGIRISEWGTQYIVSWDDGGEDKSDMRQRGWRTEEKA